MTLENGPKQFFFPPLCSERSRGVRRGAAAVRSRSVSGFWTVAARVGLRARSAGRSAAPV